MFVNIPNMLSVTRILLTPLFVICLIRDMFYPAAAVFAIAGISDALDGFFARWFNQRTVLGAYLDPIADKILLMSAFVCLAILKVIPPWLTVIVISRDIIIVIGFAVSEITNIALEIRPRLPSKCTTVAQMLTVFFALLFPDISDMTVLKTALCRITGGLTIVSGLHYIYLGMTVLQGAGTEE